MSRKSNARLSENTAGNLLYIKQWDLTISAEGTGSDNIDFTAETWEDAVDGRPSHITIENTGASNDVYIVFDASGSTITTTDRSTYNLKLSSYYSAEVDGSASSIGFRCGSSLTTTVTVRAW